MRMIWWHSLLGVLLCAAMSGAQEPGGIKGEVKRLYEEAQRFQLGIGRPRNARKAISLYQEVIKLDPQHVNACYNLAFAFFESKRYDLALKYYRRVIRLQPADGDAHNNVGTVYERQGKDELARRYYRKAIRLDPKVAAAHYNLGRLLLNEGKTEAALAEIKEALRLDPENPGYVNMHARVMGESGKISGTAAALVVGGFVSLLLGYRAFVRRRGAK